MVLVTSPATSFRARMAGSGALKNVHTCAPSPDRESSSAAGTFISRCLMGSPGERNIWIFANAADAPWQVKVTSASSSFRPSARMKTGVEIAVEQTVSALASGMTNGDNARVRKME